MSMLPFPPLPTSKPKLESQGLSKMTLPPLSLQGGAALGGTAQGGTLGNVTLDQSKSSNIFTVISVLIFAGAVIWLTRK